MQLNSKCRKCEQKDEMIIRISESNKLVHRYKTKYDWVGMVIHLKLRKRLDFHHTTKWYIQKAESIIENETHKILLDFETQVRAWRPNLVLINQKIWGFAVERIL